MISGSKKPVRGAPANTNLFLAYLGHCLATLPMQAQYTRNWGLLSSVMQAVACDFIRHVQLSSVLHVHAT